LIPDRFRNGQMLRIILVTTACSAGNFNQKPVDSVCFCATSHSPRQPCIGWAIALSDAPLITSDHSGPASRSVATTEWLCFLPWVRDGNRGFQRISSARIFLPLAHNWQTVLTRPILFPDCPFDGDDTTEQTQHLSNRAASCQY